MAFTPDGAVEAIATKLETVASVGRVHRYRRSVKRLEDVATLFRDDASTGKLFGAFVSVAGLPVGDPRETGSPIGAGVIQTVDLRIEMVRGVEDAEASEMTFRAAVFAALKALNTSKRVYADASWQGPASAPVLGYIEFGGSVVMHYTEISVSLRGRTSP